MYTTNAPRSKQLNAGKMCIQLHLKEPRAVEILKQLVAWADVLIENWAPGATARLGIDYQSCRAINPELIMVSTSLMGQYGPYAGLAGFGYHAAGMAGVTSDGLKLKNVATITSAGTGPSAAPRLAK